MTDTARVARIYVIAIALLASVLIWTAVSAAPLPGQSPLAAVVQPAADPRVAALAQRRADLLALQRRVDRRAARYEVQRRDRLQQISAARQQAAAASRAIQAAAPAPRASSARIVSVPSVPSAPAPAPAPHTTTSSS